MTGTHQAKPASWAEGMVPLDLKPSSFKVYPSHKSRAQSTWEKQCTTALECRRGAAPGRGGGGWSKTSQSACPSLHRWLSSQLCHTLPKPLCFLDGSQRVFQLPFQCLPVSGLGSQTASSPKTRSVATVCAIPCAWRRGDRCSLNVWTCNVFNEW